MAEQRSERDGNAFDRRILKIQDAMRNYYTDHEQKIKWVFFIVAVLMYMAYFSYGMYYERLVGEDSIRLLWITCLVVLCSVLYLFWSLGGQRCKGALKTTSAKMSRNSEMISWIVVILILVAAILFIIIDIALHTKQPYNLTSAAGIIIYIFLFFVFSHNPSKVRWRPVAWGVALQFVFALVILRWSWGRIAFYWLGQRVEEFLLHTDAGSKFVFGEAFLVHYVAFKVLTVVIFFSTIISVLYYLGVMQVVIRNLAKIMQVTMGTTAGESMNAAGNIFFGFAECPLTIRPLIPDMTRSELHAVMAGGMASIAGTVFAAYVSFGVPSNHLLSASVMSAPAALAMAKLFYPEEEASRTKAEDVQTMEPSKERNIVEAASAGASNAISLVANIAANLIAFIALLHFIDGILMWFGERVGVEGFTFQYISSYVLWPVALIMGVDLIDCHKVAELIGIKIFLNEFVAFSSLGVYVNNKLDLIQYNATYGHNDTFSILQNGDIFLGATDRTLIGGILTDRSEVISTYALCGFSHISAIGMTLGSLGAMVPERHRDISSSVFRAMITANVACFMTACIAGLLHQSDDPFIL